MLSEGYASSPIMESQEEYPEYRKPYEPLSEQIVVRLTRTEKRLLESLINEKKGLFFLSDVVRQAIKEYLQRNIEKILTS